MSQHIEIEKVVPEYAIGNFKSLYRFNKGSKRFYFDNIDNEIKLFPSVTTIVSQVSPFPKEVLIDLVDREGGKDGYYSFMSTKATYGTIMHICINKYLTSGKDYETRKINKHTIQTVIDEQCSKNRVSPHEYKYWAEDIKKDVYCLVLFLKEHNFEPLLIEGTGYYVDEKCWFAGAIDLIGFMDIEVKGFYGEVLKSGANKGQPKETKQTFRVLAVVDWKSGKNGFYTSQAVQLKMYSMISKQCFGLNPEKLYNVTPNETSTNFKMKDQTNVISDAKIDAMLNMHFIDYKEPETIDLLPDEITANTTYNEIDIKDYLKNLIEAKQQLKLVA